MTRELPQASRPWTPGPWTVEYVNDVDGDDHYWIDGPADKGHNTAVLDSGYYTDDPHPHYVENLRLCAIAPEMAEALMDFADAMDSDDGADAQRVHEQVYEVAQKLRGIR